MGHGQIEAHDVGVGAVDPRNETGRRRLGWRSRPALPCHSSLVPMYQSISSCTLSRLMATRVRDTWLLMVCMPGTHERMSGVDTVATAAEQLRERHGPDRRRWVFRGCDADQPPRWCPRRARRHRGWPGPITRGFSRAQDARRRPAVKLGVVSVSRRCRQARMASGTTPIRARSSFPARAGAGEDEAHLFVAEGDPPLGQVVRCHFDLDAIASEDADLVLPHLAGRVGQRFGGRCPASP